MLTDRWDDDPGRAADPASFNPAGYGPCAGGIHGGPCNNGRPRPATWLRLDGSPMCTPHKAGLDARNPGGSMPLEPRSGTRHHIYLLAGPPGRWKVGRSLTPRRRAGTLKLRWIAAWPVPASRLAYPAGLANSAEHSIRGLFAGFADGRIVDGEYVAADIDDAAAELAFWRAVDPVARWLAAQETSPNIDTCVVDGATVAVSNQPLRRKP